MPTPSTIPTIIVDTREQEPYTFSPRVSTIRAKLHAGDYSILGMEQRVAVERKSMADFVNTIMHSRKRFFAELSLLKHMRAVVVIECSWRDLITGAYSTGANPESVAALAMTIHHAYCPIFCAGDRPAARDFTERFLARAWAWEEKSEK